MRHRTIITLLTILFLATEAMAAPYNPTPYTVDNKGEEIEIRHIGDEHFSYYQTTDGRLIGADSTGCYYYLGEDGQTSNVKVRKNHSAEETVFLQQLDEEKVLQSYRQLHPLKHMRPNNEPYKPKAWAKGVTSNSPSLKSLPIGKHCKGQDLRFPVLLVAGAGSKNCDVAQLSNQLNQEGYHENKHNGSVRDYFISVSDGIFAPYFDLYTVCIDNALSNYTENVGQLLKEAVEQLKNNYPDFNASQYDADNDGEIDAFPVLYAGTENQANGLGGFHYEMKWYKQGKQKIGEKEFNNFLILAQMKSSDVLLPICSFIHEFSHCMGLKDHYSVKNKPETFTTQYPGAHAWDVMSTGMYNNGGGCPPGYSAFEKEFMGWIQPEPLVETDGTSILTPLNTTGKAYKLAVSEDEYYLLEDRQQTGWDASLPYHGMLIWHIDYDEDAWIYDVMNDVEDHQRVDIIEAGDLPVTSYADGFDKKHLIDDPYPGSQNVTYFNRFKAWNGNDLGIVLYKIAEIDNNIYFTTKEGVNIDTVQTTATLTKTGAGEETQKLNLGAAIVEFGYEWTEAKTATVTGLPEGVTAEVDTLSQTISISGTPTEIGVFDFIVKTIGANNNAIKTGSIEVDFCRDTIIYQFDYNIDLTLSDSYVPETKDIAEVFDSLGITGNPEKIYFNGKWFLGEYAVNPNGKEIKDKTANDPGQWFDADGYVSSYDEGYVYAEYELSGKKVKVGHYPGKVKAGETFTITQAFYMLNKEAYITYHIKTIDTTSSSVTIIPQTAHINLIGNQLELKSLAVGAKTLKVFDAAGHLVHTSTFNETEKTITLNGIKHNVMVTIEGDKQTRFTYKGLIK